MFSLSYSVCWIMSSWEENYIWKSKQKERKKANINILLQYLFLCLVTIAQDDNYVLQFSTTVCMLFVTFSHHVQWMISFPCHDEPTSPSFEPVSYFSFPHIRNIYQENTSSILVTALSSGAFLHPMYRRNPVTSWIIGITHYDWYQPFG